MLLTYVPLMAFSLQQQIWLGVDAIRILDPSWDQHRGPLYPTLWYQIFDLYDPHMLPPQDQPEDVEVPNFDEPAVAEEDQTQNDESSADPVVQGSIFAL